MTEKIQKAIDLLDSEAEKGGAYEKIISQHLIECITSDEDAEFVMQKDKSLKKCLESIKSKARKQAVNNCAVIEDSEVFSWAREYYGFPERDDKPLLTVVKPEPDDLDVDLFDLI